eukprot:CAMPEP_0195018670 /NCGR_PEP_ID=MMETSP0326_2-20130528/30896_1 /TAXON_ID=2866 ORGANISM="Crypthecodinium cohnii, Strain Seligo" /NCGR_SAMPLE_ID=MMETSP0326_2 /ASSEMBLY_ACC=CAM_ASM_000348 /LENGTH=48 /DNA_ID= /DNA_START= /DNA_END= /DNA_ORIENTATION=
MPATSTSGLAASSAWSVAVAVALAVEEDEEGCFNNRFSAIRSLERALT